MANYSIRWMHHCFKIHFNSGPLICFDFYALTMSAVYVFLLFIFLSYGYPFLLYIELVAGLLRSQAMYIFSFVRYYQFSSNNIRDLNAPHPCKCWYWYPFFMNILFKSFVHFTIELIAFLHIVMSSFCILNKAVFFFRYTCCKYILPLFWRWLLINRSSSKCSLVYQCLLLWLVPLYILFKKSLVTSRPWREIP